MQPQAALFCSCGSSEIWARNRCRRCYDAWRCDQIRFDGHRQAALVRDRFRCTGCGGTERLLVHHRRWPVRDASVLRTLCVRCHPKVHRTLRPAFGQLDESLRELWWEQHPDLFKQVEFSFTVLPTPEQVALFG